MASKALLDMMVERKSVYAMKHEAPITDERVLEIVRHVVMHSPSPFNVQSCRVVVLLGEEHQKFWNTAIEVIKPTMPAPAWEMFETNIESYKTGYGSVRILRKSTQPRTQLTTPRRLCSSTTRSPWTSSRRRWARGGKWLNRRWGSGSSIRAGCISLPVSKPLRLSPSVSFVY